MKCKLCNIVRVWDGNLMCFGSNKLTTLLYAGQNSWSSNAINSKYVALNDGFDGSSVAKSSGFTRSSSC